MATNIRNCSKCKSTKQVGYWSYSFSADDSSDGFYCFRCGMAPYYVTLACVAGILAAAMLGSLLFGSI